MSRRLVVEADGGSRGNPGVAGFGALVRDAETAQVLVERAEPLGKASNNVAEYSGLVAGLMAAADIDPGGDVVVRMDSKLVVEQMSGRWKIKHEDMRRLAAQARDVAASISSAGGSVTYEWIPRERNKAADALSNEGMDGHSVTRRHGTDGDEPQPQAVCGGDHPAPGPARPGAGVVDDGSGATPPPPGWRDALRAAPSVLTASPRPPATTPGDPAADEVAPHLPPVAARTARNSVAGSATRLVFVRHGVTQHTLAGRVDGRGGADPDLADQGRAQASAAARAVVQFLGHPGARDGDEVRVTSSTLRRGTQTAAAVATALGVPSRPDPAWDEQALGEFDGALLSDLAERYGHAMISMRTDPEFAPEGGESHADLRARVLQAFDAQVERGGTVVVVTHRGPVMAVLEHVLGLNHAASWRVALAHGSLTSVRLWPDGGAVVEFVNDTSHLRPPV